MACKYYADNGQPSILYNDLFNHYRKYGSDATAEKMAVASWLNTKTIDFKNHFGDWQNVDTSNIIELSFDENNEPVLKSIDNNVGFGNSENFLSLDDLEFNPLKNRDQKLISEELPESYTEEQKNKRIGLLQSRGVEIKNVRTIDGITYVAGTTDKDNIYFNDDVLSSENVRPITEYLNENDTVDRILRRIVKYPVMDVNVQIASRLALSINKPAKILLMSREDINTKYPDLIEKKTINMFYDQTANTIVVNSDIEINDAEFENIILEEIIHASTAYAIGSNTELATQWNNQFETVKKAMKDTNQDSRYLANPVEFLYGVLKDKRFRNTLSELPIKSGSLSMLDSIIQWISRLFGMRYGMVDSVKEMLDNANTILSRSLNPIQGSYMADINTEEENEPVESEKEIAEKELQEKTNTAISNDVPNELFTGNALFDKYINTLMEKMMSLRLGNRNKTGKAKRQTNRKESALYRRHLNMLKDNLTYATLIKIGRVETERLARHLDDEASLGEIGENLKVLESWKDFSSLIIKDAKKEGIELDEEVMFHVNAVSSTANNMYSQYFEKYVDSFKAGLYEQHVPPDIVNGVNIDMTIKDIGALAANFIGLSYGQNAIEQIADFLIRRNAWQINNEYIDWEHTLNEKLKKVNGDISFMFKEESGGRMRMITRYSSEMHEKMRKMRSDITALDPDRRVMINQIKTLSAEFNKAKRLGKVELAEQLSEELDAAKNILNQHKKDYVSWDDYYEFIRQNFEYDLNLSDEDMAHWEDFKESLRDSFSDINNGDNNIVNEMAYQAELAKYDPQRFINWVNTGKDRPSHAAMWFKATPKGEWLNNSYFNSLTENQKEFYDWFTDEFIKAQENIPQEEPWFGEYDMDKLLREFSYLKDNGMDKMKYLSNTVKDWTLDMFTIKGQESDQSGALKAPLSKRPVQPIKFKTISSMINVDAGFIKKDDQIDEEIKKKIQNGIYKYNEEGYLVTSKNGRLIKKTMQEKVDPLKMFTDFKKFSLNYRYKKEVEDHLNTAKELAYNAEIVQQTSDGRTIMKFGKEFAAKGKNNVDGRLSATVDKYLYQVSKDPLTGVGDAKPGERKFSPQQIIETLNNFTRARALGFNFASGITNFAIGTISNFQYAGRDEFFNEKELKKAYWILKDTVAKLATFNQYASKDAVKIMMLIRKFNLFGSFQEDFFLDTEKMQQLFSVLFAFQKGGEYLNQGSVMIAMMLRNKAKNDAGEVIKDVNGKEISIWDAYDVKDGKLVVKQGLEAFSDESQRRFASAMLQVNKEIHGDYDPLNMQVIKKSQIGRILMMLRTWMPMSIKQRLGARYKDALISEYVGKDVFREGRWRTMARVIGGKGVPAGVGNSLRFITAAMVSTLSNKYGKKIIDGIELSDEDRANMYANMKEMWWLMAISVLGVMLKAAAESAGDDDDDKEKDGLIKKFAKELTGKGGDESWMTFLYNQSARIDNDLWFYYNPVSAYKIIRDPVAIGSTLKSAIKVTQTGFNYMFDNENDAYKTGFREGNSKFATQVRMFFPVLKQTEGLWSMWSNMYRDDIQ